MKILVLCTGNSCRSQMAEGFLRSFDPQVEVYSAGTNPSVRVHPRAVKVMKEVGIDIAGHLPKKIDDFLDKPFDYVITVCDNAREHCPIFTGQVRYRLHIGFEDPAEATGTDEEVDQVFRRVRDEIRKEMFDFYSANRSH
jgi:arsenate reductase